MATAVVLPRLGMTMQEGAITRWYKEEGDQVERGEPLLQIETDKVLMDVEAPASGTLRGILVRAGRIAQVGQALASILAPGEVLGEKGAAPPAIQESVTEPPRRTETEAVRPVEARIRATPAARRLAREQAVDLAHITPTRSSGRIARADVEAYHAQTVEHSAIPAPEIKRVALSGRRKTIAERMQASAREAPHIALTVEVDMTEAERLRELSAGSAGTQTGQRLSVTSILAKVVAFALRRHPWLNASLQREEIWLLPEINLGIAVAADDGLIVPVIHNADHKSFAELARIVSELTQKARESRLSPDEVTGGTFTITNLGMYGIDEFSAIINPPQAAILAVGRIVNRPIAVGQKVEIRPIMRMTLSADHRVVDGAVGAAFLQEIRTVLENLCLLL